MLFSIPPINCIFKLFLYCLFFKPEHAIIHRCSIVSLLFTFKYSALLSYHIFVNRALILNTFFFFFFFFFFLENKNIILIILFNSNGYGSKFRKTYFIFEEKPCLYKLYMVSNFVAGIQENDRKCKIDVNIDTKGVRAASWKNQQCGFRTGLTQTGLYSYKSRLEA